MKTSKVILSLMAFMFAIVAAVASNYGTQTTYYGKDPNDSNKCKVGSIEQTCGNGTNQGCTVTVAGSPGRTAYTDTSCTALAQRL